jgi:very-short-patch-repair endonuclease
VVRLNDSFEYDFYFGASATTKALAAELRKNMTYTEKVLWQQLRNRKLNEMKFRRQHPVDIFILDFYCHEKKLAIEVDGGIHNNEEQKEWDDNRTVELTELGIHVLRFTNDEVVNSVYEVINSIRIFLNRLENCLIPNPSQRGKGV